MEKDPQDPPGAPRNLKKKFFWKKRKKTHKTPPGLPET